MPEGPEVSKMVEDMIYPAFANKVIERIEGLSVSYARDPWKAKAEEFNEKLPSKVVAVGNRGKQVQLKLENHMVIGVSFGLSGQFTNRQTTDYARVAFHIAGRQTPAIFDDQIGYGSIMFMTEDENESKLRNLGPDLRLVTLDEFTARMRRRTWGSKSVVVPLMSQRVVAGIGNYIKAESLYRARISPHRVTNSLSSRDIHKLFDAIRQVQHKVWVGIKNGEELSMLQAVYKKDRDPDGNEVIREKTEDGRVTHWVPAVQS